MDDKQVASELKGNTLRVYWYLLEFAKDFIGPRKVQRELGFSSPALAVYHLDKLDELGLVEKVGGEYRLTRMVEVGILKHFLRFKGRVIPRNVLYAVLFTTLLGFYLSQFREVNFYSLFALIFGLLGSLILWVETFRIWQSKP
ncbi:MAG: hypothetical protein PVF96_04825 [Candidatus Bathyarchaeota archaeon]|jgi:hypothetical protein